MRPWAGLVFLLLTIPGVHAGPPETALIHLHGHSEGDVIVLHWDAHGIELTQLELVRILDGQALVVPLDPQARAYVDYNVSAGADAQYFLQGRFDGGVTLSNVYDSRCPYVEIGGSQPITFRPECIPDLPGVPPGIQATVKETLDDLLPIVISWTVGQ